ncbi:alpha-L-fucosidase [Leifsonia sp. McL0607]|uniref:alpha-L-fucosidase n=1 Tax=Leifsonia sp. McL0607 TaxID=3415672 RepID=UPI003CEA318B
MAVGDAEGIQPDILINGRLLGQGDYATPEQGFPTDPPTGPWELCLTMGRLWSYSLADVNLKSARSLARTLIEVVSRGGNLLLDIGPDGDGNVPAPHRERMHELGSWMRTHRESVIGVGSAQDVDFYGPVTRTASTIYLHLVMLPVDEIVVRRVPVSRVRGVRLLGGPELPFAVNLEVHEKVENGDAAFGELRIVAPRASGALVDVVAIDLA